MPPTISRSLLAALGLTAAFFAGRISAPDQATPSAETEDRSPTSSSASASEPSAGDREKSSTPSRLTSGQTLDPAETIDSVIAIVANEPPGLGRFSLLFEAMQRITPENWHAAMVKMWKAREEGLISEEEVRYVLQRLGESAGAAALEGFKPRDPVNAWETHNGRFAMMGWAAADPAAAKTWLEAQPDGRFRQGMTWGYVLGVGLRDPQTALRTMQTIEASEQARLLTMALNDSNGTRYAGLAEAWIASNTEGDPPGIRLQNDEITRVHDSLLHAQINAGQAMKKNDKFLAWAESLSPTSKFGPTSISRIGQEFVRRNETGKAMAWIERFTQAQPAAAAPAVRNIMSQWTLRDTASAAAWLHENKTSVHYNAAVTSFLNVQRGRLDKDTTRAWVSSIRDDTLRQMHLNRLR